MTFVQFVLYALDPDMMDRCVSINVDAIGCVSQHPDYTLIMVTGGEGGTVMVAEKYDDVLQAIHKADGDIE